MTHEELLEHLSVVAGAENALYACDEAIKEMERKRSEMQHPPQPIEPIRGLFTERKYHRKSFEDFKDGLYNYIGVVFLLFIAYLVYSTIVGWKKMTGSDKAAMIILGPLLCYGLSFLIGGAIGLIVSPILAAIRGISNSNYRQNGQLAMDKNYEEQMSAYRKAIITREQQIQLIEATKEMIGVQIEAQRTLRQRISEKLKQLYAQGIIHPNFRNIVAVNQIKDYIETGICEKLEGTGGAYAMYMQDIRAQRICASIDDLKESMMEAMSRIAATQAALARAVRENNMRLEEMGGAISSGFSGMQRAITAASETSDAQMERANGYLRDMERTLRNSAHNEYVALREANIDAYLLRRP